MKVKELISILEDCNLESEILLVSSNSSYVESIKGVKKETTIHSFWGKDFNGIVIVGGVQKGSI